MYNLSPIILKGGKVVNISRDGHTFNIARMLTMMILYFSSGKQKVTGFLLQALHAAPQVLFTRVISQELFLLPTIL